MKIRLTKRFANFLDGIDLSRASAGDVLDLSTREATLLILEGWAMPVDGDGATAPQLGLPVGPAKKAENKPRPPRKPARRTPRSPQGG